MKALVCALTLIALTCTMIASAPAVEMRAGNSVVLSKDKPVTDDVAAAGDNVTVEPEVKGDVLAAGQSVAVSGPVKDSVMLAGHDVTLTGKAGNDAFMAGRFVAINAPVASNAYLVGDTVTIGKDGSIGTDLLVGAKRLLIAGKVGRNVRVRAGFVTISGEVGGNVYADLEGDIRLTSTAVVKGDVFYESPNKILMDDGAKVLGKVYHRLPPKEKAGLRFFSSFAWRFGMLIAAVLFGAVVMTLFPERAQKAADTIRSSFWPSAGAGCIAVIVVPILCVLAMITVVGFPLALAAVAAYAILIYASRIFAALALGQWILGRGRETKPKPMGSMILGLIVLAVALPIIELVPVLGGLVSGVIGLFVLITGFGGLLVSWWRDRRQQQSATAPDNVA